MPVPDQLQKGHIFADGDVVNAALLNSMVDEGTALAGLISEQTTETPLLATSEVLVRTATGNLRKRTVSTLPNGVTSVGLTMPSPFSVAGSPVTTSGTLAVTVPDQAARKFYASPAVGTGQPGFRVVTSRDLVVAPVVIAASTIDWSLGNVFTKGLTANTHPILNNGTEGQAIYVHLFQTTPGNFTVTWDAVVRWAGGVAPVMSTGTNHSDIYQFWLISGIVYGQRIVTNAV